MKANVTVTVFSMALVALTTGCQRPRQGPAPSASGPSATGLSKDKHVLADEPGGAKHIFALREEASQVKDGEEIVVVGRIGGSKKPFTGRASFTIVDASLKPCNELEGDTCEEPWDYCCEPLENLARATLLIKIVDPDGKTFSEDAQTTLGLEPLQTVVVRGRAQKGEGGRISSLNASGVFVRADNQKSGQ
jgi:hypothetical protein